MKEGFRRGHLRRTKLIIEINKIMTMDTWTVSLMWTKDELQEMDRKSRKLMIVNWELHSQNDSDSLYAPRNSIGRGLMGYKICVVNKNSTDATEGILSCCC